MITPRTIAYAALSAVLIFGTYYFVRQWNRGQAAIVEAQALKQTLADERAARERTERALVEQTARNRKIEHDTNENLARAGAAARDLALGLRRYYEGRPGPQCPAAPAPGSPDAAGRESGDRREVEEALANHLAACGRDAERLTGLQLWAKSLPSRCIY